MPAVITTKAAVIHKLIKAQHAAPAVQIRDEVLAASDDVAGLVEQIHVMYSKRPSKGIGHFEDDVANFPAAVHVGGWWKDAGEFLVMTQSMMATLKAAAQQAALATGGFVLFAHVTNGVTDWLLVALITNRAGAAIDETTFEVKNAPHVDIDDLRIAGRVDLTAWVAGNARYVSFLKTKGDVSEYFKVFLGCNDVVEPLRETKRVVDALRAFGKTQELDEASTATFLKDAYDLLDGCNEAKTPIDLEAFCNALWSQEPDTLKGHLASDEWQISSGFVPDRRSYRALVKYDGKGDHWKISFDREALDGDLHFDRQYSTLTVKNLPPDLLDRLMAETAPDDDAG